MICLDKIKDLLIKRRKNIINNNSSQIEIISRLSEIQYIENILKDECIDFITCPVCGESYHKKELLLAEDNKYNNLLKDKIIDCNSY